MRRILLLGTAATLMAVAMVVSALPAFANSDAANYCHDQRYPYEDYNAGQVFQNSDECVSYFAQN